MNIFKISLPGIDVKRSRPSDEVVDSLYPSPKVSTIASPFHAGIIFLNWQTANLTKAFNSITVLYSFPHGYNHIPIVLGIIHFDNGSVIRSGTMPFDIGAIGLLVIDADSTNVNLKYLSLDISSTFPIPVFQARIRFYVFAERGHA